MPNLSGLFISKTSMLYFAHSSFLYDPVIMIRVTCAIIESESGVLCARRGEGMTHAGMWEFPGGKVEKGESNEACLIREIREELDVTIEIISPLDWQPFTYPGGLSLALIPFRCRIVEGQPKAIQHEEIRWVTRENLPDLNWAEADVPVLKDYLNQG